MKYWAIIGGAHNRKELLVRALTGAHSRQTAWPILMRSGEIIRVHVDIGVKQERSPSAPPSDYVEQLRLWTKNGEDPHALIVLRHQPPPGGDYSALDYLHTFDLSGWQRVGMAVVDDLIISSYPAAHLIDPGLGNGHPINALAAELRDHWGFV